MSKGQFNPWLIAILVACATFMEVLDMSIANVSLNHIAGSLGASPEEATWVLTSYLVTNAIALPVAGWMSEYFGRTRFFIVCIIGFTAASLACGLAPSLETLIFFRAIQGLTGGALQPVSQAILADTFPIEKRAIAFSVYGIAVVAAPAIGPSLGGWITDEFSWHWIFLINVPIGILLVAAIRKYVPDEPRGSDRGRVDYFGFGLIAIGLGSLQWVLDRGQHEDWFDSDLVILLTVMGIATLASYILRSLRQTDPIVNLRLFRHRNYAVSNLLMFVMGFVLFSSTAMLPLFMQTLLGYSASDAGMVMSWGGVAIMVMMPIIGLLAAKQDARILITIGMFGCAAALWHLGSFSLDVTQNQIALARVWQNIGISFLYIPITTLAYIGLPERENNQASSMLALMRNLGGGFGIAIMMTLVERLGIANRQILTLHTSPIDLEWQQSMQDAALMMGDPQSGLMLLDSRLTQQAQLLAFMDGFRALALLVLVLVPLIWWLKPMSQARSMSPSISH